jgi:hypothetical protein
MVPLRSGNSSLEVGERVGALKEDDVTPLGFSAEFGEVDCVARDTFGDIDRVKAGSVNGPKEGEDCER